MPMCSVRNYFSKTSTELSADISLEYSQSITRTCQFSDTFLACALNLFYDCLTATRKALT
jgi:hypothetical protein